MSELLTIKTPRTRYQENVCFKKRELTSTDHRTNDAASSNKNKYHHQC